MKNFKSEVSCWFTKKASWEMICLLFFVPKSNKSKGSPNILLLILQNKFLKETFSICTSCCKIENIMSTPRCPGFNWPVTILFHAVWMQSVIQKRTKAFLTHKTLIILEINIFNSEFSIAFIILFPLSHDHQNKARLPANDVPKANQKQSFGYSAFGC